MNKLFTQRLILIITWIWGAGLFGQEMELINTYDAGSEMGLSMRFTEIIEYEEDLSANPPMLRLIIPNTSFPQTRYRKEIDLPPLYRITAKQLATNPVQTEVVLYFTTLPDYTIDLSQGRILRVYWEPLVHEAPEQVRASRISPMESTVSLNFKDAPIIDLLRLLQAQNNLNIVAGEEIKGTVTIALNDVNLGTALDVILKVNGYDWFLQENILVIKPIATEMEGSMDTRIYKLDYADASAVANAISNVLTKKGKLQTFKAAVQNPLQGGTTSSQQGGAGGVLGAAGSATGATNAQAAGLTGLVGGLTGGATGANQQQGGATTGGLGGAGGVTNADHILVTDVHYNFPKIERLIYALDKPVSQINIAVKFIETRLTMDDRMGINWSIRADLQSPASGSTSGTQTTGQTGTIGGQTGTTTGALAQSALLDIGHFNGLKMATLSLPVFQALLEVLSTDGKSRLLQEPSVTAQDNTMATVTVGTTVPVLVPQTQGTTTGGQTPYTFQDEEVNVTLNVFPRINEGRFISMAIDAQIEAITGYTGPNNDRPIVSRRQTQTQVTVETGETLLIGGLIYDQAVQTHTTMPILGKIPVIKRLFNHTINTTEQTELLIFITPNIIKLH
ncbi:MAG: type II secretion system protein GspD [Fidelibacterota bacterium]